MEIRDKSIGFALTGSHCTYNEIWAPIGKLIELGGHVHPIASPAVVNTDTRFGRGKDICQKLSELTGRDVIIDIVKAEPIGPQSLFDIMIIAPCTGNTMAGLANGITNTGVLMAAKAHLRNELPLVLAISTNDGLGLNARNLGVLLNTRHVYFVPFGQDNPVQKTNSLVADMDLIVSTMESALQGRQLQPVLIERQLRHVR